METTTLGLNGLGLWILGFRTLGFRKLVLVFQRFPQRGFPRKTIQLREPSGWSF